MRTRDAAGVKWVKVFLDDKLVKRSTREDFEVNIKAAQLGEGTHTVLVTAANKNDVRSERSRTFDRCDVPMIRTIETNIKECVATDFRVAVNAPTESARVEVSLNGKVIKSSTKNNFRVLIEAKELTSERHRFKAVSTGDDGKRIVRARSFTRCDRLALPTFTG